MQRDEVKKAVALRYDAVRGGAPQVAASGRGDTAERILALARDAGIDVVEDPDLLEVLSRVPVGETIPIELFQAVAEILAFVYSAGRCFDDSKR